MRYLIPALFLVACASTPIEPPTLDDFSTSVVINATESTAAVEAEGSVADLPWSAAVELYTVDGVPRLVRAEAELWVATLTLEWDVPGKRLALCVQSYCWDIDVSASEVIDLTYDPGGMAP